jgi:RNA polymerase sigma-70 factor (sigma-E family)
MRVQGVTVLSTPEDHWPSAADEFALVLPGAGGDTGARAHARGGTSRDDEFTVFAQAKGVELGRTAWLLTGDVHLAAELVQIALVRTYVAWPRARATDPTAYARRVLANARIDHWRRRRREVVVDPAELPEPTPLAGHAHAVETRHDLVAALATLSPGQRRVVVLRYLLGLSEREVAEDLGISEGSVKTHASRGLKRLRQVLTIADHATGTEGIHRAI